MSGLDLPIYASGTGLFITCLGFLSFVWPFLPYLDKLVTRLLPLVVLPPLQAFSLNSSPAQILVGPVFKFRPKLKTQPKEGRAGLIYI